METKVCTKCGIEKELSLFRKINKVDRSGNNYIYFTTHCKKCINKVKHESEKKYPEKYKAKLRIKMAKKRKKIQETPELLEKAKANRRRWKLKREYGITVEKYEELVLDLNGKCQICGDPAHRLVIDHCHNSNKVRGLLCDQCNTSLGGFKDNIEIMRKAIEYIKDPPLYKILP
jgi:hypothetical protein